jgi:hypothetical protein
MEMGLGFWNARNEGAEVSVGVTRHGESLIVQESGGGKLRARALLC